MSIIMINLLNKRLFSPQPNFVYLCIFYIYICVCVYYIYYIYMYIIYVYISLLYFINYYLRFFFQNYNVYVMIEL
jgi:hypothetical protein